MNGARLPVDAVTPELAARLAEGRNVVLEAPPGAGKTTRAPLALLGAAWLGSMRIVVLEPRRVAARAAAERMAAELGETVGATVGYRIRDEAKVGGDTRIEVVTEGVLTRRIQSDPELRGIGCVIFDEIHERALTADLGLALCLETQAAFRPDLRLAAMSATLDAAAVAALMDADVVRAEGRSFPVEIRHAAGLAPAFSDGPERFSRAVADRCGDALEAAGEAGDVLAFLPGAREIRAAEAALGRMGLGGHIDVMALMGEGSAAEQRRAIAPAEPGRRKIVLATAVAETSLTLPGVVVVVDGGRSRRSRFDAGSGMGRLTTTRVSKAGARQRAGRAGRVREGVCLRLWSRGEEGALAPFDPPEIMEADLAGLALELAEWGARPQDLPFLDQPPVDAFAQAEALLSDLGALDARGRITDHGRALARAPLHPRLAHLVVCAGADADALRLAALLSNRDPLSSGVDVGERLSAVSRPERHGEAAPRLKRIRVEADQMARRFVRRDVVASDGLGVRIALAFPDRIAARRPGQSGDGAVRYLTSGGKGARLSADDPLAGEAFLAVAAVSFREGAARDEATIRLAAPLARSEIESTFADRIVEEDDVSWSSRERRVRARRVRRLGALPLAESPLPNPPKDAVAAALLAGVRALGVDALPWSPAARRFRRRMVFARSAGAQTPDVSDAALLEDLEAWLGPRVGAARSMGDLERVDFVAALRDRLDWPALQALDAAAPAEFTTPLGGRAAIDYAEDGPRVAIRLQELFGVATHPVAAGRPIAFELLSPAGRPIQITSDLPGFWRGAYVDVAKEMRGRYPKHPWPDDPAAATPTRRAKPRR